MGCGRENWERAAAAAKMRGCDAGAGVVTEATDKTGCIIMIYGQQHTTQPLSYQPLHRPYEPALITAASRVLLLYYCDSSEWTEYPYTTEY